MKQHKNKQNEENERQTNAEQEIVLTFIFYFLEKTIQEVFLHQQYFGVLYAYHDALLSNAKRKHYQEKCDLYDEIAHTKRLKSCYATSVIIPFVYGPHGQIYAESERVFFEKLGVVSSDLSPAKREAGKRSYTDKRYLDNAISKQALCDLKFEWNQLKKFIVQYTMENAISWCAVQAKKQRINTRKYHRFNSYDVPDDQSIISNTTSSSSKSTSSSSSSISTRSSSEEQAHSANNSTEQKF